MGFVLAGLTFRFYNKMRPCKVSSLNRRKEKRRVCVPGGGRVV